jgi:uncharacterized coiled-coil protein SlyX
MDEKEKERILYRLDARTKRVDERLDELNERVSQNEQELDSLEATAGQNQQDIMYGKGVLAFIVSAITAFGVRLMGLINF